MFGDNKRKEGKYNRIRQKPLPHPYVLLGVLVDKPCAGSFQNYMSASFMHRETGHRSAGFGRKKRRHDSFPVHEVRSFCNLAECSHGEGQPIAPQLGHVDQCICIERLTLSSVSSECNVDRLVCGS